MPTLRAYVIVVEPFRQPISPGMNLRFGVLADDESDAERLVREELAQRFAPRASGETLSESEAEALGLEPYRPRLLARR